MKYTEVNPFTGKNIDEDAPANATGPSVAGTGDDSSVVVVRKKKKKDTFKEEVDPKMFERELLKIYQREWYKNWRYDNRRGWVRGWFITQRNL